MFYGIAIPANPITASLLLEIDERHCENQDRGPTDIKLFFFSIEHIQPFASAEGIIPCSRAG
jgi:hypothetical protein